MRELFGRRIRRLLLLNLTMVLAGTLGYSLIEGWDFLDALFMTVITIGSVGYGEVRPLSDAGQIFTIFFILIGVGTLAFSFSVLVESLLSAELQGVLKQRRMEGKLSKLKDHIIVCGYGRVGRNAVAVLTAEDKRAVVVVENTPALVEAIEAAGLLVVAGDATQDEVLRQAGIERAWGLVVSTGSDSVNLFVVLSARALKPDLTIVARASQGENEAKMIRAGANRVVSPYSIGGQRMAHSLLRPHLTEFLDVLTVGKGIELWLEELHVSNSSALAGKTMAELDLRRKTGVTLLGILRADRNEVITPSAETRLQPEDDLIVIGTRQQLETLEDMLR